MFKEESADLEPSKIEIEVEYYTVQNSTQGYFEKIMLRGRGI